MCLFGNSRLALIDAYVGVTDAIDIDEDLKAFVAAHGTSNVNDAASEPVLPEFVELSNISVGNHHRSHNTAAISSSNTTSSAHTSSCNTSDIIDSLPSPSPSPDTNDDDTPSRGRFGNIMASRVSRAKAAAKRVANKRLPSNHDEKDNSATAVYDVSLDQLLSNAMKQGPEERALASRLELPWFVFDF